MTLLAQYIAAPSETILDSLRDILIELEDSEPTPETSIAKAAAATAFVRAGELEEAVDVLSSEEKSLEWSVMLSSALMMCWWGRRSGPSRRESRLGCEREAG